jgi:hypothetical protein
MGGKKHRWSAEEDSLLMETVARQGALDEETSKDTGKKVPRKEHWLRVSCALWYLGGPHVTPGACQMRWLTLTGKKKKNPARQVHALVWQDWEELESRVTVLLGLSKSLTKEAHARAVEIEDLLGALTSFVRRRREESSEKNTP